MARQKADRSPLGKSVRFFRLFDWWNRGIFYLIPFVTDNDISFISPVIIGKYWLIVDNESITFISLNL